MEPIKLFGPPPADVFDREGVSTIGWQIGNLPSVLPQLNEGAGIVVDASALPPSAILCSIVGPAAKPRTEIRGFPALERHSVSDAATVEIEVFLVVEASNQC